MKRKFRLLTESCAIFIVFTQHRLILVDKQGITGKKVKYHSIPYKSIVQFAVETAGAFGINNELKIWISGSGNPINKEFNADTDITGIQKTLASFILKKQIAEERKASRLHSTDFDKSSEYQDFNL